VGIFSKTSPVPGKDDAPSAAEAVGGIATAAPKTGVPRNLVFGVIVGLLVLMVGAKFVSDLRSGTFGEDATTKQRPRELPTDDESAKIHAAAHVGTDATPKKKEMTEEQVRAAIAAPANLTAQEAVAAARGETPAPTAPAQSSSAAPVTEKNQTRVFDPNAPTPDSLVTRSARTAAIPAPAAGDARAASASAPSGAQDAAAALKREQALKDEQEVFNLRSSPLLARGETVPPTTSVAFGDAASRPTGTTAATERQPAAQDPVEGYLNMLGRMGQAQAAPAAAANSQATWLGAQRNTKAEGVVLSQPALDGPVILPASVLNLVTRTTIRSDLEGDVVAVVTDDVRDTVNGSTVVIPKGSQVLGSASSTLQPGQERAYTAFRTLYFPDGRSFELRGLTGSDASGASGLPADVTRHLFRKYGAGLLLGAIAYAVDRRNPSNQVVVVGAQAAQQQQTLSQYAGGVLADTTKSYIEAQRNVADLLVVPAGTPFTVIVRAPLVLVPSITSKRP